MIPARDIGAATAPGGRFSRRLAACTLALLAVLPPPAADAAGKTARDTVAMRWGYQAQPDAVPPERWGELPDGANCARGHHQSPIALYTTGEAAARFAPIPPLAFAYRLSPLRVSDNGRLISVPCDSGGSVSLAGTDYALMRVDLHAPSEHTLDGRAFPMELQFVHRSGTEGVDLIVAVFLTSGQKNAALEAILRALPRQPGGSTRPSGVWFDPAALLPARHNYFDYQGSLSCPPCTEGVRWCVMRTPVEVSQDQLDRYLRDPRLAHSSRPILSTNGRAVRTAAEP